MVRLVEAGLKPGSGPAHPGLRGWESRERLMQRRKREREAQIDQLMCRCTGSALIKHFQPGIYPSGKHRHCYIYLTEFRPHHFAICGFAEAPPIAALRSIACLAATVASLAACPGRQFTSTAEARSHASPLSQELTYESRGIPIVHMLGI